MSLFGVWAEASICFFVAIDFAKEVLYNDIEFRRACRCNVRLPRQNVDK